MAQEFAVKTLKHMFYQLDSSAHICLQVPHFKDTKVKKDLNQNKMIQTP